MSEKLGLPLSTVYVYRARVRKKLNVPHSEDLTAFVQSLRRSSRVDCVALSTTVTATSLIGVAAVAAANGNGKEQPTKGLAPDPPGPGNTRRYASFASDDMEEGSGDELVEDDSADKCA
jgi:hypothetical protein